MKRLIPTMLVLLLVCFVSGCVTRGQVLEMRLAQIEETSKPSAERLVFDGKVVATERDIEEAGAVKLKERYGVGITLTKRAVWRIYTRMNEEMFSRLAIHVDGQLVAAVPVSGGIDQRIVIAQGLSEAQARALAHRICPTGLKKLDLSKPEKEGIKVYKPIDLRKYRR